MEHNNITSQVIATSKAWKIVSAMLRLTVAIELTEDLSHEDKVTVLRGLLSIYESGRQETYSRPALLS